MRIAFIVVLLAVGACKNQKAGSTTDSKQDDMESTQNANARLIVYKTKADYANLVPLLLSDDKTKIVSYPHPDDVTIENKYPVPINLHDGYVLDKRGINRNVAFLNVTYAEYAKWDHVPSLQELGAMIRDKDPLLEMYDCGEIQTLNVEEINHAIDEGKIKSICK